MEAAQGCDHEAASDVEDAPEAVGEIGHAEHSDPDTEELSHCVRVEQELSVSSAQTSRPRDTGMVEAARHKLAPVDQALSVVLPDQDITAFSAPCLIVSPVQGQHDGGEQREVGHRQDQGHSELSVV